MAKKRTQKLRKHRKHKTARETSITKGAKKSTKSREDVPKGKKREAYDIFTKLRSKTAEQHRIDSLIIYLERELGIK